MTDKPKCKPEKRETANSRRERFTADKPEVRGIYKEKEHHAAIKAFAKSLKTGDCKSLDTAFNDAVNFGTSFIRAGIDGSENINIDDVLKPTGE